MRTRSRWFPFTAIEVEITLAVIALLATLLGYLGTPDEILLWVCLGLLWTIYLAGLAASHSHRGSGQMIPGGAVAGRGYIEVFAEARESLLLMHVDQDQPCIELRALYGQLLEKGVHIRRIVLQSAGPEGLPQWAVEAPSHAGLLQRVALQGGGLAARASFAVIDSKRVVLAVPGVAAGELREYEASFVLRDLLILSDPGIARSFVEVHRDLWSRSKPLRGAA